MERDSATFCDKGTEVPSLSRDKGMTGQAQNLEKGREGPRQPVKIRERTQARVQDRTRDGTVPDFDSLFLSCPHCNPLQGQYRARTRFSLCSISTQGGKWAGLAVLFS